MKFVVITYAPLIYINDQWWGYAPYIREMNLWLKYTSNPVFVCPVGSPTQQMLMQPLENSQNIKVVPIYDFNLLSWRSKLKAIPCIFWDFLVIFKSMWTADHIHLRVPGNIGLIAAFAQIFFPWKRKTAKYAGNWDWKSQQPVTYRMQQLLLQNRWVTKNIAVLVYGHWPDSTQNIVPFFTASYSEKQISETPPRPFDGVLKIMFVGSLVEGKRPLLTIQAIEALLGNGIDVELHMFGNGPEFKTLEAYIGQKALQKKVYLHGNQPEAVVKNYFQKSHFLVFLSKSEGWPKVVAESMFWGCLPITTAISCVPEMVDFGRRGTLVGVNEEEVVYAIQHWMNHPETYYQACLDATNWSRQFTLEKFENQIAAFL